LIFGAIFLLVGFLELNEVRKMTAIDLIPTPEAQRLAVALEKSVPVYTYIILGFLIAVSFLQFSDLEGSIDTAGFDKPLFWQGDYWRILTSGVMHAGLLHLFMKGQALFYFGKFIETLTNRAHVATIFVLSVVAGNLFSLVFMPEGVSVGASGGIMGLLGFLAIFGFRRKREVPASFVRNILTNLALIAVIGVIGAAFIDNAAHLGGLVAGTVYGLLMIPSDKEKSPQKTGLITQTIGFAALILIILVSIYTITLLINAPSRSFDNVNLRKSIILKSEISLPNM
jgi:membrane associated rhomboid family serine protease